MVHFSALLTHVSPCLGWEPQPSSLFNPRRHPVGTDHTAAGPGSSPTSIPHRPAPPRTQRKSACGDKFPWKTRKLCAPSLPFPSLSRVAERDVTWSRDSGCRLIGVAPESVFLEALMKSCLLPKSATSAVRGFESPFQGLVGGVVCPAGGQVAGPVCGATTR